MMRFAVALACGFALAGRADAHPLGNFTINHLTRLGVAHGEIEAHYVLDMAELPAYAELQPLGGQHPRPAALQNWAEMRAREIARTLTLDVDGSPVILTSQRVVPELLPGAGGLRILHLTIDYTAPLTSGALTYADRSFPGRLGWKDVLVAGEPDPTNGLRLYPSALVGSPREVTTLAARIGTTTIARVTSASAPVEKTQSASLGRSNALADMLAAPSRDPKVLVVMFLVAIALGALHALEPGHGKTLLAISLVGARATPTQAFVLAGSLTVAHTIGVLLLGVAVLFAARWIVPEAIYPWITLVSGVVVAIVGARALARGLRHRHPHAHVHAHAHADAHPHEHAHAHGIGMNAHHTHGDLDDQEHALAHAIPGETPLRFAPTVLAAMSGGIAPCPAALVVLLTAISVHKVGLGLALIVAFSAGLAAVLTGLGIAVVRGSAWLMRRPQFDRFSRLAPLFSAGVIGMIGAIMVGEGLVQSGLAPSTPLVTALVLFAIAGYAFTGGHAHAHGESAA